MPASVRSAMAVLRSLGGPPCTSTDPKSGRRRQIHHAKFGLDHLAFGHRHGFLCREAARAPRPGIQSSRHWLIVRARKDFHINANKRTKNLRKKNKFTKKNRRNKRSNPRVSWTQSSGWSRRTKQLPWLRHYPTGQPARSIARVQEKARQR